MFPTIHSFRDLLRLLFLYRRVTINTFVGVVATMVLGMLLISPRYASEAKLLVKPGKETLAAPVEMQGRALVNSPLTTQRDVMLDEISLLKQEKLAQKVAAALLAKQNKVEPQTFFQRLKASLKQIPDWLGRQIGSLLVTLGLTDAVDEQTQIAHKLQNKFKVEHEAGSAILSLQLDWKDPQIAQLALNTWVDNYLADRLDLQGTANLTRFFEQQLKESSTRINDLEQQIRTIQQQIGALELSDADRSMQIRMDELLKQEDELKARLSGIQARSQSAQTELRKLPAEIASERIVTGNPNVQKIRDEILATRIKRQEMLRIYKPDTPQIQMLNKTLEEKERWLSKESEKLFQQESFAPNPAYQNTSDQVRDQQLSGSELRARLQTTQALLKELAEKRVALMDLSQKRRMLEREWQSEQDNYRREQTALNQARLDYELERQRISNVEVVQAPDLPIERNFPRPLQLLLAMPFLAAIASVFAAVVAAFVDQRPQDGFAIATLLGTKLLVQLPDRDAGQSQHAHEHFDREIRLLWAKLNIQTPVQSSRFIALTSWNQNKGLAQIAQRLHELTLAAGMPCHLDNKPATPDQTPALVFATLGDLKEHPQYLNQLRVADEVLVIIDAQDDLLPTCKYLFNLLASCKISVSGLVLNRRPLALPEALYRTLS